MRKVAFYLQKYTCELEILSKTLRSKSVGPIYAVNISCMSHETLYGRAAIKVRRCPPEGMAGLSKLRGCPREGAVGHVTEGFPPLGNSINTRGGKNTRRLERLRL